MPGNWRICDLDFSNTTLTTATLFLHDLGINPPALSILPTVGTWYATRGGEAGFQLSTGLSEKPVLKQITGSQF
jgi:hypothetical protein